MTTHKHGVSRGGVTAAPLGLGPRTATFICGTILVLAAYALETRWIAHALLGFPIGLWLVAAGTLAAHLRTLRRDRRSSARPQSASGAPERNDDTTLLPLSADAPDQPGLFESIAETPSPLPVRPAPLALPESAGAWARRNLGATALELAGVPARHVRAARLRVDRLTERLVSGQPKLHIGVDLSDGERSCLIQAAGGENAAIAGVPVSWTRAPSGLIADGPLDARKYDVLIRRGTDARNTPDAARLTLFVSGDDRPETCIDWGRQSQLCYASLFPARLDADRVTLEVPPGSVTQHAKLTCALVGAAAVLSRSSARCGALTGILRPATLPDAPMVLAAAMNTLADALLEHRGLGDAPFAPAAVASRLLGRYATTIGVDLPSGDRADLARLASEKLPADPGATLRMAAAELAAGETERGTQSLIRAFRQIRAAEVPASSDTLAFVMSEAEHGATDRMTLGRVCAGICLAWATTPADSLDYLQDDLIDDLKHAGWLIGRERELTLLKDVIAVLERELLAGHSHVELKHAA